MIIFKKYNIRRQKIKGRKQRKEHRILKIDFLNFTNLLNLRSKIGIKLIIYI